VCYTLVRLSSASRAGAPDEGSRLAHTASFGRFADSEPDGRGNHGADGRKVGNGRKIRVVRPAAVESFDFYEQAL